MPINISNTTNFTISSSGNIGIGSLTPMYTSSSAWLSIPTTSTTRSYGFAIGGYYTSTILDTTVNFNYSGYNQAYLTPIYGKKSQRIFITFDDEEKENV
ncbi:MAG: hypothetical protein WC755_07685 [Candidatus Woesearchaeota archaeon]|jgi:hypothetical protein